MARSTSRNFHPTILSVSLPPPLPSKGSLPFRLSVLAGRVISWPALRFYVLGAEYTQLAGPWLLASNHISHFDPLLLNMASQRQIEWMAMVEVFEIPVVRAWCRAMGAFPVDRKRADTGAVRGALKRLHQGKAVGLFPEGGIRDGPASVLGGASIRPGVGALAQMGGVPVVPALILGSDRLYTGRAWLPWPRTPIWIAFGEPIMPPGRAKEDRDRLERLLVERLRALSKQIGEQYALQPEDWPQPGLRRKGKEAPVPAA